MIPVQRYIPECESCACYIKGVECKILELFLAEECPCHICLVKTMCEEGCEEYNKLTSDVDEELLDFKEEYNE